MRLVRTVAGAVLAAAAVGGATSGLVMLGTAGATSGRRAEVDATPADTTGAVAAASAVAAGCGTPAGVLSQTLNLPARDIRLRLRAGETIAHIAETQGVDRQTVVDALVALGETNIDRGVQYGRLTDDQAATRRTTLATRVAARVDNPITAADGADGRGQGLRRLRGPGGGGGRAQVAAALGMSLPDLRQARASGQSLAQIAEAHGVDPQQLIDKLVADARERITARVNATGAPGACGQT
jgi:hypothetical protein